MRERPGREKGVSGGMTWATDFDPQPTLIGDAVLLRPLAPHDWDALFAVAADPQIWALHPAHDRWQEPVFRRYFDDALASGGALAIIDTATGAIIGSSRYDRSRADADEVEIGWTFIARSHWGGATNAAVKALMIGHAHASYPACVFYIGETNFRSRRAIEKIGGVLIDDRYLDAPMADGALARHVVYAIRRGDAQ